jgi:ABC-type multidrug transport system ATPase subunit
MLLSLITPDSGDISIFGKNLFKNRNEVLSNIGAVIERPDSYKYLSAYDNLNLFAKMSGLKLTKSQLMDQLDRVGLADRSESKVKTYSQGMKQRLGIAVALVNNPDLIILDEPTNGLDPQGISDIRKLILSLSSQFGKTILVSSHLLNEIEVLANRMIIINKGKKIVEGVVKELLDPSKTVVAIETTNNAYAFDVINQSNTSLAQNAKLSLSSDNKLHIVMDRNGIPDLIKYLIENQVGVIGVNPRHSLEEYFLSLTKTD